MVAAPETKSAAEVAAVMDVKQDSAEELKKSKADAEKEPKPVEKGSEDSDTEEATADESEATGSKEPELDESAKLQKAGEKLAAGKKSLLQNLPQQAVDNLAEACSMQSAVLGDMAPEMCEYYYYYGKALLELARIEGDVLGNALTGVPEGEDLENSQVENPAKLTEDTKGDEEEEDEGMEAGETAVEGEDVTQEEDSQDEDISSLQLAWEVLELSKTIYEKSEKLSDEDTIKLSQVYLKLGEVSLENENYPESINMYEMCLKSQKSVLEKDDRWLAETHYQLGLAHSLSDQFDEGVTHLKAAITVIETRIASVTAKLAKDSIKLTEDMDVSSLTAEQKSAVTDIKELKKLLPELQDKMTDINDTKASYAEKLATMKSHLSGALSGGSSGKSAFQDGASTSSGFGASSDDADKKDAKPIATMLIRKKRKPEEEAVSSEETKKPRTETVEEQKLEDKKEAKSVEKEDQKEEAKSVEKKEVKPEEAKDEGKSEEKMDVEEEKEESS